MMELQAGSGVQEEQSILPAANKKYKDTIFRMLFSDKKNLLSLYNALNGKNYSDCDQSGDCNIGECHIHEYEE